MQASGSGGTGVMPEVSALIEALGRGLHSDRVIADADVLGPCRTTRPGGTVTGEHGVGILKRDGMRRELDPGSLAMQSAIRHALDPRQLFNPGKG